MTDAPDSLVIRSATKADTRAVLALLRDAGLSIPGVVEHFDSFLVAERAGVISGAIGLELRGNSALLRSAVVSPQQRGAGIGRDLYSRITAVARDRGVSRLFLLTTTAEAYWARLGFERITRDDVPPSVRESAEFTGACPASATVMALTLS